MSEKVLEAVFKASLPVYLPLAEILEEAGFRLECDDVDADDEPAIDPDLQIDRIETLGEGGFLTMDRGVAVYLNDGSAFTVTIGRYRNPTRG